MENKETVSVNRHSCRFVFMLSMFCAAARGATPALPAPAGFSFANLDEGLGTVPSHKGEALGAFQLGAGGAPLAEGAAESTARQILLDLRGYPHPSILMVH